MKRIHLLPAAGLLLLALSGAAHAAGLGTLACNGGAGSVKMNISFYTFGDDAAQGSASGAAAGKVSFAPLEVYTSLAHVPDLAAIAAQNASFTRCTLDTTLATGDAVEYAFDLVALQSANVIGSAPLKAGKKPSEYIDLKLQYGAVQVQTGVQDDGGSGGKSSTTIPGGWNRVKNTQDTDQTSID